MNAARGTGTATAEAAPSDVHDAPSKPSIWRIPLLVIVLAFAAFWIWALFFASKEAVNKVGDREWAARAEQICAAAEAERRALADPMVFDPEDPAMLVAHADLLAEATDIVEEMLDDVVADVPRDDKGAAIVPMWAADYRIFIENRRDYIDRLRAGDRGPFTETAVDGIPISEKVAQFAGDNEMPSCAPPHEQGL